MIGGNLYFCAIHSEYLNQKLQESHPSRVTIPPFMKIGNWASENTNTYSLFHCPRLEAPPAQIGGRQLLSGYRGWVYSHGLANHTRNMYMERLNRGDSEVNLKMFKINYLYQMESPLKNSEHSLLINNNFLQVFFLIMIIESDVLQNKNHHKLMCFTSFFPIELF
jgi:hypothetical protein